MKVLNSPEPMFIGLGIDDRVREGKQGIVGINRSSRKENALIFVFEMCSIETKDWKTMRKPHRTCTVADEHALEFDLRGFADAFNNGCAVGVRTLDVLTILRQSTVSVFVATVDLRDCFFSHLESFRICDFDAKFSLDIFLDISRTIKGLIFEFLSYFFARKDDVACA